VIALLFTILTIVTIFTTDAGLSSEAYRGPVYFWLQVRGLYVTFGFASLLIFLTLPYIKNNCSLYSLAVFLALGVYLVKLLMPLYIFNGLTHYDIFDHYLNVKTIASSGLIIGEFYSYWPSTFLLTCILEKITGLCFPISIGLLALISKVVLALLIFGLVKVFFGSLEGVLSILLLTIVEPYPQHWCPYSIATTLVLLSFALYFYAVFRNEKRFTILSSIIAFVSLSYHPFLPVTLGMMIMFGVCSLILLKRFTSVKTSRASLYLASAILIGAVSWWFYISFFIFKTVVITVEDLSLGRMPSQMGLIGVTPASPDIVSQLEVVSMLRLYSRLIILLPPLILALFKGLPLMVKRSLDEKYIKILLLMSVAGIFGLASEVLPIRSMDRFRQISEILLVSLSGVSICEFALKDRIKKAAYIMLAILYISAILISPISGVSIYIGVYRDVITVADESSAAFIATRSVNSQLLTGDARFEGVIDFFKWPNLITFSLEFEDNAKEGLFDYHSSAVMVSLATPNYVTGHGVSDMEARKHITELTRRCNIIFSNGYDTTFTPR
jgi:hypothetical protein